MADCGYDNLTALVAFSDTELTPETVPAETHPVFSQKLRLLSISKCSATGPRLMAGKNIITPKTKITRIIKTMNSGVSVLTAPVVTTAVRLAPSDPAMASPPMMKT